MADPSSEEQAIEDAYRDYLKQLFSVLARELIEDPDGGASVKRFATGATFAKKARALALGVIAAPAVPLAVALRAADMAELKDMAEPKPKRAKSRGKAVNAAL